MEHSTVVEAGAFFFNNKKQQKRRKVFLKIFPIFLQ
jgi:hypothetical protein